MGAADLVMDRQPIKSEGGEGSAAEPDHLADVLSPLEQILLAADQELGAIRGRVDLEAGRDSERAQQRVREATLDQQRRVALMRAELTDRASALAACYEEMLNLLDQAESYLAIRAQSLESGVGDGAVKVTLTERRRLTFAHEPQQPAVASDQPIVENQAPSQPTESVPAAIGEGLATATEFDGQPAPSEQKGIRRWWRRLTRSAA